MRNKRVKNTLSTHWNGSDEPRLCRCCLEGIVLSSSQSGCRWKRRRCVVSTCSAGDSHRWTRALRCNGSLQIVELEQSHLFCAIHITSWLLANIICRTVLYSWNSDYMRVLSSAWHHFLHLPTSMTNSWSISGHTDTSSALFSLAILAKPCHSTTLVRSRNSSDSLAPLLSSITSMLIGSPREFVAEYSPGKLCSTG